MSDICGSDTPAIGVSIMVPEPGTWALTTLGFAGLGAALRTQRGRAGLRFRSA
jgi:hypothetical protein